MVSSRVSRFLAVLLIVLLSACAVKKEVIVGAGSIGTRHSVALLAAADGNSPAMDAIFQSELKSRGFATVQSAPAGTRQAPSVDVIVEYIDVWRWDISMYLDSISVRFYDPQNGGVIAVANWGQKDQMFHSYPKPEDVVREVLSDVFAKVKR
jgi:hypothetical protein